MVRKYKKKNAYNQWSEDSMSSAIHHILARNFSLRVAATMFNLPRTSLQKRLVIARLQKSMNKPMYITIPKTGHPTIFNDNQEKDLCERVKQLAKRGFDCNALTVRMTAFVFAEELKIKHPWGKKKIAGTDWFAAFYKRNKDILHGLLKRTSNTKSMDALTFSEIILNNKNESNKAEETHQTVFPMEFTRIKVEQDVTDSFSSSDNLDSAIVTKEEDIEDCNFVNADGDESLSPQTNNIETLSCGFCNMKSFEKKSIAKGAFIMCLKCKTWYHEVCVGAHGRKDFVCGRCF